MAAPLTYSSRELRRRRGVGERTANRVTKPRSVLVDLGIASDTTLATRVPPRFWIKFVKNLSLNLTLAPADDRASEIQ